MTKELDGKTAIVTGGASGIGAAIARRFARAGCRVAIADRDAKACGEVAEEIGGEAIPTDVKSEAAVEALMAACEERLGGLDALVNNAGIVPPLQRTTEEVDAALWDEVFAINVRGVILCTKHAVPMLKRSRGSVINMSSVTGWRADPKQIGYSASKHAVIGITEACAQDLGRYGIRVNAICPGPVATEALLSRIAGRVAGTGRTIEDSLAEDFAPKIALGQVTTPEEVAEGALYLASDASRGVSALQLRIDGGNMSWPPKEV